MNRRGFTLLEMSIVLLIIALIAGGVMVTKSLIRTANLQGVLREYDIYVKATKEFVDKFQAMPGDMSAATGIWGTAALCPPAIATAPGTSVATCNGDGDGKIASGIFHEYYYFWQHLANAGLIDGRYTGAYFTGNLDMGGVNIPASNLKPGGWGVYYFSNPVTTAYMWGDVYSHILVMGNYNNMDTSLQRNYSLRPIVEASEAYALDKKIDDGKPGTGNLRGYRAGLPTAPFCTENDTSQTAAIYHTSYKRLACALVFITGF